MPYHLAMAPNMSNLSLLYSKTQIFAIGEIIVCFSSAETLACPLGQAAPRVGFEPTTLRLTAECTANCATGASSRIENLIIVFHYIMSVASPFSGNVVGAAVAGTVVVVVETGVGDTRIGAI